MHTSLQRRSLGSLTVRALGMAPLALLLGFMASWSGSAWAAGDEAAAFVIADVAPLREAANEDAPIKANLRIATPLVVLKSVDAGRANDGWAYVAPRANPALTGFVAAGLISRRPPSAAEISADLDATIASTDVTGARVAAERLFALQPEDRMVLVDLMEIARAGGDDERAASLADLQAGRGAKHLGYCRAKSWSALEGPYALGVYAPGGRVGFTPPTAGAARWRLPEHGDPAPALTDWQAQPWFVDDRGLVARLDDSDWTLTPGVRLSAGLTQPNLGIQDGTARSVCVTPGALRSSEPFVRLPTQSTSVAPWRARLKDAPELGLAIPDAFGMRAAVIEEAGGLVAMQITYERSRVCARCAGALPDRLAAFALIEPTSGEVVLTRGHLANAATDPTDLVFVHAVTWGRWSSSGEVFAVIEWEDARPGPGGGPFIDWLVFNQTGLVDGGTFVIERRGLERAQESPSEDEVGGAPAPGPQTSPVGAAD